MSVIEYKFEQYKSLGPIIYRKEKYNLQVELLKLQEDVIKNKRRIALCFEGRDTACLLYTSPSPRDRTRSRMPSSA